MMWQIVAVGMVLFGAGAVGGFMLGRDMTQFIMGHRIEKLFKEDLEKKMRGALSKYEKE